MLEKLLVSCTKYMSQSTCQNYSFLIRNVWSGWKTRFNDSNLSVNKLPTSTVNPSLISVLKHWNHWILSIVCVQLLTIPIHMPRNESGYHFNRRTGRLKKWQRGQQNWIKWPLGAWHKAVKKAPQLALDPVVDMSNQIRSFWKIGLYATVCVRSIKQPTIFHLNNISSLTKTPKGNNVSLFD